MPSRSPVGACVTFRKSMTDREMLRDWQKRGACTGPDVDPEIFYPVTQYGPNDWVEPKRVCGECPVKQQCLEYALKSHGPYGMWGGTTPIQRSNIIKAMDR